MAGDLDYEAHALNAVLYEGEEQARSIVNRLDRQALDEFAAALERLRLMVDEARVAADTTAQAAVLPPGRSWWDVQYED